MVLTCGIDPEELRVSEKEHPPTEHPLETAWTFWYDKKTSDRKESDQYMEGLRQLGSFNTIEGFYRHYTYLLRPNELPRDHNVLLFRKGYKPMWEEFPEGGCWIVRIKRKASQSYVNRMWEHLLLAAIGEAFELPDLVGCVLSTRMKDDVLSVWNLSNQNSQARFRIGEKLKEVLDLDMNALIQYKDHMQSLQDYSTYRNAKNYMFAPSPSVTPLTGTTPIHTHHGDASVGPQIEEAMLPPPAIDDMLPPSAIDSEAYGSMSGEASWSAPSKEATGRSPGMSASAAPWAPPSSAEPASSGNAGKLSPAAAPWYPPNSSASPAAAPAVADSAAAAEVEAVAKPESKPEEEAQGKSEEKTEEGTKDKVMSYAAIAARAASSQAGPAPAPKIAARAAGAKSGPALAPKARPAP